MTEAQDQRLHNMKEQDYNKINTKTKTQELNDIAISTKIKPKAIPSSTQDIKTHGPTKALRGRPKLLKVQRCCDRLTVRVGVNMIVLNIDESCKPESFPIDGWLFCHIDIGYPSIFSKSISQNRLTQSLWKVSKEVRSDDVLSSILLRVLSPGCSLSSIVVVVAMVVFCYGLRPDSGRMGSGFLSPLTY
ncbi:hypothetical protein Tco_0911613 [Tanacetum coccineum]|uniref:Uncharacterized protein n=1 Tax=Tanacetum coccineum TaxID=301880 RepID=A0ABQ5CYI5_9ASTR